MGNTKSITEAYEEWKDDRGDVGQLREFIAKNKQHIDEQNFVARTPFETDEESMCPALVKACEDGKLKIVDELIEAGADLTAADLVPSSSRPYLVWQLPSFGMYHCNATDV